MRRLRKRTLVLLAIALAAATLFVRLGLWQLDRLDDRRARNTLRATRSELPAVRLEAGPIEWPEAVEDSLRWRRAELEGHWLYDHEFLLRARIRDGRAGVEVVTPFRTTAVDPRTGASIAVLVLRGWLPARDGLSPDLSAPRGDPAAASPVVLRGVLEAPPPPRDEIPRSVPTGAGQRLAFTSLDVEAAGRRAGIPLAPLYLRATEPTAPYHDIELSRPVPRDDGPHLSYALQWFAFAAIALVGVAALAFKEDRKK